MGKSPKHNVEWKSYVVWPIHENILNSENNGTYTCDKKYQNKYGNDEN